MGAHERTGRIVRKAQWLGFDLCGIVPVREFEEQKRLLEWLERGCAGEMKYMQDPRRQNMERVMANARSVIVCALNYNTNFPYSMARDEGAARGEAAEADPPRGWMARYAWGEDYHKVLGQKLEMLLAWMCEEFHGEFQARPYVDTGPVLEKVAAKYAGLGWIGKNTCLIHPKLGSWLFLGVILTDLDLAPSVAAREAPPPDLCGSCRRCLDACPTEAIVEPYVLDARRCISYLTIELRGSIPEALRPGMGGMVFGCDICQDVCPWNRKAPASGLAGFLPRTMAPPEAHPGGGEESFFQPRLEWLVSLDEKEFRRVFRGSAVQRAKWRGMIRNACVALGNSKISGRVPFYRRIVERLEELAESEDEIIGEHARWALERLKNQERPPHPAPSA